MARPSTAEESPKPGRSPKKWLELSQQVPFEFVEPVAELFRRYAKGGVAIEEAGGWNPDEGEIAPARQSALVRAYMPLTPAYRSNREMVHVGVALVGKIAEIPPLIEREVAEREWEEAWKAHFTPLRVGQRIAIKAPWHTDSQGDRPPQADLVDIVIDPGLAFGTGHHPTTYRTLACMERLLTPGARVLDVGAGSGVLSIGAAKLGASRVLGVEIDRVALRAGRANVRANGESGRVRLYAGTLPHPRVPSEWADLVLANVNSVALAKMAPELRSALTRDGRLVAAGILQERRAEVEQAFGEAGLIIDQAHEDDEWVALVCRPTPDAASGS